MREKNKESSLTQREFYINYASENIKQKIDICCAIMFVIAAVNVLISLAKGDTFFILIEAFYFFVTALFIFILNYEKKKILVIAFLIVSILCLSIISIGCCVVMMRSVDEFNYMWNDYLENNNSKWYFYER